MIRKIILPIIFIVGLLIFFYPIVGNWLSSKDHYTVITKHNEVLAKMDEEEKEKERKKAKEYNDSIAAGNVPLIDPFSEEADEQIEDDTGYYDVLDIGNTMGSLEIPALKVNLPIYHGISEDVLTKGIGHMANTSLPVGGKGTHTALTGHRGLPSSKLFRDLDKLEVNDVFYIHTLDETLAYQVDKIDIVLPTETDWLELKEDKDYATLITCEPYMINTHRMLVRGERIPYVPTEPAEVVKKKPDHMQLLEYSLFIAGIAMIVLLIIVYIMRIKKRKGWVK